MKPYERSDPTKYRALVRRAKAGKANLDGLLGEARHIKDPYFAALALFDLSANPWLGLEKAFTAAEEALKTAGKVESQWRRAEVLSIIAKKLNKWRDKGANRYREKLLDGVMDGVLSMPKGKGLSDAISGCVPRIGCNRLGPLLEKAVSNRGFETTDVKAVVRHWSKKCSGEGPAIEDIMEILEKVDSKAARSKLMGYLHLQCRKSKLSLGSVNPLRAAVEAALGAEEERLDAMRYLAGQSSTKEEIEAVALALDRDWDPASRARLIAALGTSADRAGMKEMALDLFNEGLRISSQIKNPKKRDKVRLNLTQGLERCGDIEEDISRKKAIHKTGGRGEKSKSRMSLAKQVTGANDVLALYDAYEGGLKPVHIRAVARAAPLCAAFGLDLALMGFPTDNLEELIGMVTSDTTVGRGGGYLKELVEQGRVVLVPCTRNRAPENWEELGLPVATTSHPRKDKRVNVAKAVELSRALHPLRRACLIMGLGKRGLPQSLLDAAPYHLELTGSDVPLETCTAMGVIAQLLYSEKE
jgi:hypothetical protein